MYFKDGVGQDIDDKWFRAQMFPQNTKTLFLNPKENPFKRSETIIAPADSLRFAYPKVYNQDEEVSYQTRCCNSPTVLDVNGKKLFNDKTQYATSIVRDLRLPKSKRQPSPRVIGLNATENDL